MRFTLVGTGNMAWFLADRLIAAGHICTYVCGRDIDKAIALANTINAGAKLLTDSIEDNSDCCIVAVSDNAISDVNPYLPCAMTIIYTAGTIDINTFTQFSSKAVLWPVYSIVKGNLPAHRNIPCMWEANTETAKNAVLAIANAITDVTYEGDSAKRTALHLGAVFSNNFSNHLFAIAEQWCNEQGLDFNLLKPIIQQTVSRLNNYSPYDLQTGPARRSDDSTINKHINLLQQHADWQSVYQALTASIKEMYNK